MRRIIILLFAMLLIGCTEAYKDLEKVYGTTKGTEGLLIEAEHFSIISLGHNGITTFENAEIRLNSNTVVLRTGAPFMNDLVIPALDIDYCAMTCFGCDDQRVDLLIGRTKSIVTIKNKNEMLDWCWENRIPVISFKDEQAWQYKNKPLPPKEKYLTQLESREEYNKQAFQNCMGISDP